ncbi:hypothetical protein JUN65_00105 [Gluconacetobacter azotocaptans]|uniref:hypothetical protein n=1 Tax=Gluconacetobacter azotocaptans TaxID=142834 RepID=UPI00195B1CD5|nr:hypothetical protein [Gluconacetobacter azotocaptans]MBM9400002.1 hypothetical protein [Gluconacetobacter azotocaptans]
MADRQTTAPRSSIREAPILFDRISKSRSVKSLIALIPGIFLGLGTFAPIEAHATCTRHIYNKSTKNWLFQAFPARAQSGDTLGNVWFEGPSCQSKNGPCLVKPGEIVTTKFTTTNSEAKGQIRITDIAGKWVQGDYHGFEQCPTVSGGPPFNRAVLANTPIRGDFTVLKDTWW